MFATDSVDLNASLPSLLDALAGLTPEARLSVLSTIEPILDANSDQLGLFPGQAQLEVARLSGEFNNEESLFATLLAQFSGVGRASVPVPQPGSNNETNLPGRTVAIGTSLDDRLSIGGTGASLANGGSGNDRLTIQGDGSHLFGGAGNDVLSGPSFSSGN